MQLGSTMEFKRTQQEDGHGYSPPPIRPSAFSKPLLPTSSSLVSPRGIKLSTDTTGVFSPISTTPAANSSTTQIPSPIGGSMSTVPLATPTVRSSAPDEPAARYRECLRNHAASIGGHVLDGCGEFMPGSDDALKCAACGCHRSFHRRETDHGLTNGMSLHHFAGRGRIPLLLPSPSQPRQAQGSGSLSPLPAGFGRNYSGSGGATTESSSEELAGAPARAPPPQGASASRKRFRTKFTAEQKDRMTDLAERVGWRIQKQDEAMVESFCADVGVTRRVLKVWMHNNKHNKRQHREEEQQHQEQHEKHQQQVFVKRLGSCSP